MSLHAVLLIMRFENGNITPQRLGMCVLRLVLMMDANHLQKHSQMHNYVPVPELLLLYVRTNENASQFQNRRPPTKNSVDARPRCFFISKVNPAIPSECCRRSRRSVSKLPCAARCSFLRSRSSFPRDSRARSPVRCALRGCCPGRAV